MNQETIAKAHRAERELIETNAVFDQLRTLIIDKWAETGIDAVEAREKLYAHYVATKNVQKALQACAASGVVERHSVEVAAILAPARR